LYLAKLTAVLCSRTDDWLAKCEAFDEVESIVLNPSATFGVLEQCLLERLSTSSLGPFVRGNANDH
jgi:hypothetical protein